jgi:hypothetical protein
MQQKHVRKYRQYMDNKIRGVKDNNVSIAPFMVQGKREHGKVS